MYHAKQQGKAAFQYYSAAMNARVGRAPHARERLAPRARGRRAGAPLPAAGRRSRPGASSAPRRCCAGSTRARPASCRAPSSRSPRLRPDRRRSATGCSRTRAGRAAQWQRQGPADCGSRSTCRRARCARTSSSVDRARSTSTGIDAVAADLEITETAAMEDTERATSCCAQLRELGVHLVARRLRHRLLVARATSKSFPIDMLKIDRSFVQRCSTRPRRRAAIVEAIIVDDADLGLKVSPRASRTSAVAVLEAAWAATRCRGST